MTDHLELALVPVVGAASLWEVLAFIVFLLAPLWRGMMESRRKAAQKRERELAGPVSDRQEDGDQDDPWAALMRGEAPTPGSVPAGPTPEEPVVVARKPTVQSTTSQSSVPPMRADPKPPRRKRVRRAKREAPPGGASTVASGPADTLSGPESFGQVQVEQTPSRSNLETEHLSDPLVSGARSEAGRSTHVFSAGPGSSIARPSLRQSTPIAAATRQRSRAPAGGWRAAVIWREILGPPVSMRREPER